MIISCAVVLVAAIVYVTIFFIIPKTKYDKAVKKMNQGNYVEALYELQYMYGYVFFDENVYEECAEKAVNKLMEEEKYEEAVNLILDFNFLEIKKNVVSQLLEKGEINGAISIYEQIYWEDVENEIFETFSIDSSIGEKQMFEAVSEYLDGLVLSTETEGGYLLNIVRGGYDIESEKKLEFISKLLMEFPTSNKDAWKLKMLCDGLTSYEVPQFIYDNRGLLESFWHYGMVRRVASDAMEEFLIGEWISSDDSSCFLYLEASTYSRWSSIDSYTSIGLPTPNVPHKSFGFDNANRTLIFTNDGDTKVCDVFKFELDEQDPSKLHVYCYENGETITLTRK